MKLGYILLILAVCIIAFIIIKPSNYFEHLRGRGGGRGWGGRGGFHGGFRGGHNFGHRWGNRGFRNYGGWGTGYGWLYDPVYYYDTPYIYNVIDDDCHRISLQTYKNCIDNGTNKEICADNLAKNMNSC